MTVTGIPTILGAGMLGTTIPLTANYSLTAAHVAKFSLYQVKSYHPECDLAVIYHKNEGLSKSPHFRNGMIGEQINMYGYSFISALPVASSGVNLINTRLENEWNKSTCIVVATSAGVVQGMSGGAVYNTSDDSISGVIVGYTRTVNDIKTGQTRFRDVSLCVPYSRFKDWLNEAVKS